MHVQHSARSPWFYYFVSANYKYVVLAPVLFVPFVYTFDPHPFNVLIFYSWITVHLDHLAIEVSHVQVRKPFPSLSALSFFFPFGLILNNGFFFSHPPIKKYKIKCKFVIMYKLAPVQNVRKIRYFHHARSGHRKLWKWIHRNSQFYVQSCTENQCNS